MLISRLIKALNQLTLMLCDRQNSIFQHNFLVRRELDVRLGKVSQLSRDFDREICHIVQHREFAISPESLAVLKYFVLQFCKFYRFSNSRNVAIFLFSPFWPTSSSWNLQKCLHRHFDSCILKNCRISLL